MVDDLRAHAAERRARAQIEQAFPDLPVSRVTFFQAGADSEVYVVNDEWLFRFPKRETVSLALSREIAVLPKLAVRLPVATPRFTYVGRHTESGLLFVGYRCIVGAPLTRELYGSLVEPDQERILATLADFLRGVHGFPMADAAAAGVEELSTREWVATCWSSGQSEVLPLLAPAVGAALVRLIEGFLGDAQNFAYTSSLLYADFAPEHVLYDADARRIVGIIDWGDLATGDPDFDLLYLRQDYGEAFVKQLLGHYVHPDPARLFEKLRVFDACDQINTIVARGSVADADSVYEATAALREILTRGG